MRNVLFIFILALSSIALSDIVFGQTLHLVTLSDNSGKSSDKIKTENGVNEMDCYNKDVAAIVTTFAKNVVSDNLRIYHAVTDNSFPRSATGREPFHTMKTENLPGCKNCVVVDHHPFGNVHLANKPEIWNVGDLRIRLAEMKGIGHEDTVVVFVTAHGKWIAGTDNLEYRVGEHTLHKKDILEILGQKSPRLMVVFSDVCSTVKPSVSERVPPRMRPPASRPVTISRDSERISKCQRPQNTSPLFRSLFFESRGVADICAAENGNAAFSILEPSKLGGVFTNSLTQLLEERSGEKLTWKRFHSSLTEKTNERFQRDFPHGLPRKSDPKKTDSRQKTHYSHKFSLP